MESNLKLHSLGIVVETKPDGTDYILVSPIEELNIQAPGSIKEYTKDYKGDKKELESTNFKTEHEAKNYIRAKWLPFGHSNRISAPDVVVNETVILFKFGDVDEFYWTTIFREPILRRLETVMYGFSNVKDGIATKAFDKTTSYWAQFSTKEKHIHIHTAKNDGEPFEYDVFIDTKTGFINMRDDVGNFIELNSKNNAITFRALEVINLDAPVINLRSSNGAMTLNGQGITSEGNTLKNITTTGDRTIADLATQIDKVHSRGELKDRKTEGISDTGIINKSLNESNVIGNEVSTQATSITSEAGASISLTSPQIAITGQTAISGNASVDGNLSASGKVLDAGGNSNHHTH